MGTARRFVGTVLFLIPLVLCNRGLAAEPDTGPPLLLADWRRSLLTPTPGQLPKWQPPTTGQLPKWLDDADAALAKQRLPLLSPAVPITVRTKAAGGIPPMDLVIVRNYQGVSAIDLHTGQLAWESASRWSLETMASHGKQLYELERWLLSYREERRPGVVYDNSVVGTLSTDGQYVFAVEDFAVPPPSMLKPLAFKPVQGVGSDTIAEVVRASKLQAYYLAGGKLKWEIGGAVNSPLGNAVFRGPPLPSGGSLYVLVESRRERLPLSVLALCPPLGKASDVRAIDLLLGVVDPATGKDTAVRLTTFLGPEYNPVRRIRALQLVAADGVLVVETHAGSVLGVELQTQKVLWHSSYPTTDTATPLFRSTPPVIQRGKVVFAATDGGEVCCLNLKDGSPVWKTKRAADDVYLAGVFGNKVLVVGKRFCRTLSLATGEQLWLMETGLPSGFGTADDETYYLPLRSAAASGGPEVCALDLAHGKIMGHSRPRKQVDVPGNLVFAGGRVLSLTTREIVVYPRLKTRLAEIDAKLKQNPKDALALIERGELYLSQGDPQEAADALHQALENKPEMDLADRVRAVLYDALTELFQHDFAKAERYLAEYERLALGALAGVGARDEEKRRRTLYLTLLARGRDQQGKLREALDAYLKLAEAEDELLPDEHEPALRISRKAWIRHRITEMLKNAKGDLFKLLGTQLDEQWQALPTGKGRQAQADFLAVVGPNTEAGRDYRLTFAERLLDLKQYPTAEQYLEDVYRRRDDVQRSGRAVYLLARLETERGLIPDAGYYYRVLARDFADVKVHDGKTGKELFACLATDKRLLPFLEEETPAFGDKVSAGVLLQQESPQKDPGYEFEQIGTLLPFFRQYRLGIAWPGLFKVVNRLGDEADRMNTRLTETAFLRMLTVRNERGEYLTPRYCFHNRGHLVVLPLGRWVFGIDPVGKQVLWERNLMPGKLPEQWPSVAIDPRDGSVRIVHPDDWQQRLARTDPVLGDALVLNTPDGVVALDPLTGKTLWQRNDLGEAADLFGDDDYTVVVGPDASHVLRTADGTTVKAPDCRATYGKRLGTTGHTILLSETADFGFVVLRRYDVVTGKDVWRKAFRAGSLVLRSDQPDLTGVVEPNGSVHVLGVADGKELLTSEVDPQKVNGVAAVHLMADTRQVYLVLNRPVPEQQPPIESNLQPEAGLARLTVNGAVYAFERGTGEMRWHSDVRDQQLILNHFAEMPLLLFTARHVIRKPDLGEHFRAVEYLPPDMQLFGGHDPQRVQAEADPYYRRVPRPVLARITEKTSAAVVAIAKNTGKYRYAYEVDANEPFHTLRLDPIKGAIELTSERQTIRFIVKLR